MCVCIHAKNIPTHVRALCSFPRFHSHDSTKTPTHHYHKHTHTHTRKTLPHPTHTRLCSTTTRTRSSSRNTPKACGRVHRRITLRYGGCTANDCATSTLSYERGPPILLFSQSSGRPRASVVDAFTFGSRDSSSARGCHLLLFPSRPSRIHFCTRAITRAGSAPHRPTSTRRLSTFQSQPLATT